MSDCRKEFESRSDYSKRLLWKRGGSAFAEDVPESDYVDQVIQRDWLLWSEAWQAARRAALEEAAKACKEDYIQAEDGRGNRWIIAASPQHAELILALAGDQEDDN